MENVSNRNGRALEHIITADLANKYPNSKLTARAAQQQSRDKQKVDDLPASLAAQFRTGSQSLVAWTSTIIPSADSNIEIDRLDDSHAQKGDVTDIRINLHDSTINLSIKHNHFALKHQRPPTAIEQLGFSSGSTESISYRKKYKSVLTKFFQDAHSLCPGAAKLSELKGIDPKFINKKLYAPICQLVQQQYKKYGSKGDAAQSLFSFLVGNAGFYKAVLQGSSFTIYDFNNIPAAKSFSAEWVPSKPNYVNLTFSNGWKMSLRLHTASSRLAENVSVKFDTQPQTIPIKKWEV